ncbi:hypothetical protein CF113_14200 [Aeromonas veronii]|nr:hypothetical protein CF113_14200 [Aeromonas veronii]
MVTNFYISDDNDFDSRQLKEILREYILPHLKGEQIEYILNNYAYRSAVNSEFTFKTICNANGLVHGVVNFYKSTKDWPYCLYQKDYMAIMKETRLDYDSFVAYLDNMDENRISELLHLNLSIIQLKQLRIYYKDSLIHDLIDRKLCAFENDDKNYNANEFLPSKIYDYITQSIKMDMCNEIHKHFVNDGRLDDLVSLRKRERELGIFRIHVKKKERYAFEYMSAIELCHDFMEKLPFDEINKHILTKKCYDHLLLKEVVSQQKQLINKMEQLNMRVTVFEGSFKNNIGVIYFLFFLVVVLILFL